MNPSASSKSKWVSSSDSALPERSDPWNFRTHQPRILSTHDGSASPEPREPLPAPAFIHDRVSLYEGDCFQLLKKFEPNSVQAVVTDPPYGLVEFSDEQLAKLRSRKGGVWRIPPSFDGSKRSPLPRFTVLSEAELFRLQEFFADWGRTLRRVLVPGSNVIV